MTNDLTKIICDTIENAIQKSNTTSGKDMTYLCTVTQVYQNNVNTYQLTCQNVNYVVELKHIRLKLNDTVDKLDEMQEKTDKRFEENEKNTNRRIRAELKDKIGQSYRYYHKIGKINDMELEALEDLIKEYESVKGENSFVHSVVQKEMYTWEQVERI